MESANRVSRNGMHKLEQAAKDEGVPMDLESLCAEQSFCGNNTVERHGFTPQAGATGQLPRDPLMVYSELTASCHTGEW